MPDAITFAQCLNTVMQKHHLSIADLGTMIGVRADLKQTLGSKASYPKQKRLFEKLLESKLFEKEDYEQLASALEVSRLGSERYRFQLAIAAALSGEIGTKAVLSLESGELLEERLRPFLSASKLEILCLNSCFSPLSIVLKPFFEQSKSEVSMYHYVDLSTALKSAEFISNALPLLFDSRYHVFDIAVSEENASCIGGNLLLIRAVTEGKETETAFLLGPNLIAYEVENASASHLFDLTGRILQSLSPAPMPIKEETPHKEDFPALCMTFLSHELNRATYSITNDLCFHQTPTQIAVEALRDKALFSDEETELVIQRTLSIHEQRYRNQYWKKKPTYRVMSIAGCKRFLATGKTTDHFVGFRPFTIEERQVIFSHMLSAAQKNRNFVPLLLKEQNFKHRYNLVCYDKLGISIDEKDTDYDISNGYHSVFLMLPAFTQQYIAYYIDILAGEKCYTRQESLKMLENMYEDFLSANHLSTAP